MNFIKYLLLFVMFGYNIYAQDYILKKTTTSKPVYFIKMGAYYTQEHARKTLLSFPYEAGIIFMKKYYSIVSHPFDDLKNAQKTLQKIRQEHKDAYLITLYQNQEVEQKRESPSPLQNAIKIYNTKQYEKALAAFDRILIETPDNMLAQLYYAKSLYQLKFYTEAKKIFKKLAQSSLQKEIKQESNYYLSQIEHKRKKHFFDSWISTGIAYDDNINLTTDKPTTKYGPYLLKNDTNKTTSTYGTLSFLLTHTYKAETFTLYSTLYSYNELFHSAKGNDLNFLDFSSAIVKKYKKFSWIFPVGINTLFLDAQDLATNLYTNPAVIYQINQKMQIKTNILLNDNHTVFATNRDYLLLGGGVGIRYKQKRWAIAAQVQRHRYNAKQNIRYDISKDLTRYKFSTRYQMLSKSYASAAMQYEKQNFSDLDPVMGYKRKDTKKVYTFALTQQITQKSDLTASYTYTDNASNINTFTYSKNNYTLSYKQRF